jgi:hypothetical protein
VNKRDIQNIITEWPTLTSEGFGVYYSPKYHAPKTFDQKFDEEQSELLESAKICTKICEWLKGVKRTKNPNREANSYTMKHEVERDIGKYCSNGQFICAAIHMGFVFKREAPSLNGVNAFFNISSRCIQVKQKEQLRKNKKEMGWWKRRK